MDFKPYVLQATHSHLKELVLVCRPSWAGAVVAVSRRLWFPVVGEIVIERVIPPHQLPGGVYPTYKLIEESACQSLISELKESVLKFGGSPEAVLALNGISPFTEKEVKDMAKAATAKLPKAKGEKAAKPVGGGGEVAKKKRGNPEALAKAREAGEGKRAEFAAKKIKGLVKLKDAGLREGSGRYAKLEALLSAKTVGDVIGTTVKTSDGKEHTIDAGAVNGAVGRGHISLS